jgi:opacity protein-like surface antigen
MKNVLVAFAVTLGLCSSAVAADVAMPTKAPITPPAPIQGWTYSLTPYFWAISLDGSTTVKGRTSDVDVGFFNILDHTQFPKGLFQLAALARRALVASPCSPISFT